MAHARNWGLFRLTVVFTELDHKSDHSFHVTSSKQPVGLIRQGNMGHLHSSIFACSAQSIQRTVPRDMAAARWNTNEIESKKQPWLALFYQSSLHYPMGFAPKY
jgi:hypothetical protein